MGPGAAECDRLVIISQSISGLALHWLPGLVDVMDRLVNVLCVLHRRRLVD